MTEEEARAELAQRWAMMKEATERLADAIADIVAAAWPKIVLAMRRFVGSLALVYRAAGYPCGRSYSGFLRWLRWGLTGGAEWVN